MRQWRLIYDCPTRGALNMARDEAILQEARRDAQALVNADPQLADPDYALLRRMVLARYGKALDLGDVG